MITPTVSIFDSLATGMVGRKAPAGYQGRVCAALPGMSLEETVEAVKAAGGWVQRQAMRSKGRRPGRLLVRTQQGEWFVLPDSAFDE